MKILLFVPKFLPHCGGVETVVTHLAIELRKKGHQVLVLTGRYPRSLPGNANLMGIEVRRLYLHYPCWQDLRNIRLDLFIMGFLLYPIVMLQLLQILRQFKPDVINLHYVNTSAHFISRLKKWFPSIPLIVSLHGGDVDGEPWQNARKRARFNRLTQQADLLTACSQFLANQAVGLQPAVQGKLTVLHNGVDLERLHRQHWRGRAGAVGRAARRTIPGSVGTQTRFDERTHEGVYEAIGIHFEDEEAEKRWFSSPLAGVKMTTLTEVIPPGDLFEKLVKFTAGHFLWMV